jgi:hypothetical protein
VSYILLPRRRQKTSEVAGFEVLTAVVMKSTVFWDITPCSPLETLLAIYFMLVYFLAYSSTLKKEATYYSETSVDFQRAT